MPFLPPAQSKSMGHLDLSGTTDMNIGSDTESRRTIDVTETDKSIVGKAVMNGITRTRTMLTVRS